MRAKMRKVIRKSVQVDIIWKILHVFYRFFNRFKVERDLVDFETSEAQRSPAIEKLKKKFKGMEVQNGPFKGLKYPAFISHSSAMFPKLLGSYECELYTELESLLAKNNYQTVIDIGCAEGYYAVGLARRLPEAMVYAYDLDASALDDCRKMAVANNVKNIELVHRCSAQTFLNFNYQGKGLVISDCEGYELELFTPVVVAKMKNCDVIIELHDHRNERITPWLEKAFSATHNFHYVLGMNTFTKLDKFKLRGDLTDEEVATFFTERSGIGQWGIYTPKV